MQPIVMYSNVLQCRRLSLNAALVLHRRCFLDAVEADDLRWDVCVCADFNM